MAAIGAVSTDQPSGVGFCTLFVVQALQRCHQKHVKTSTSPANHHRDSKRFEPEEEEEEDDDDEEEVQNIHCPNRKLSFTPAFSFLPLSLLRLCLYIEFAHFGFLQRVAFSFPPPSPPSLSLLFSKSTSSPVKLTKNQTNFIHLAKKKRKQLSAHL